MTVRHEVHPCCIGEKCMVCGFNASHKVGEEHFETTNMHNFTAYVCCDCFGTIMGPAAKRSCANREGVPEKDYKKVASDLRQKLEYWRLEAHMARKKAEQSEREIEHLRETAWVDRCFELERELKKLKDKYGE